MSNESQLWWSVWWPWAAVWAVTFVALVVAGSVLVAQRRTSRRRAAPRHANSMSVYLNNNWVMGLYQRYELSLRREVEERISSGTDLSASAEAAGIKAGGSRKVTREIFRKYIEEAKPITVIGIVLNVLENDDAICYVDLEKQRVVRNAALSRLLDEQGQPGPTTIRARELGGESRYVSVAGRYRMVGDDGGVTVFVAPYGDPDGPKVRVQCVGGLGRTVSEDTFPASCLGSVQGWKADTGELVIEAIAIFR